VFRNRNNLSKILQRLFVHAKSSSNYLGTFSLNISSFTYSTFSIFVRLHFPHIHFMEFRHSVKACGFSQYCTRVRIPLLEFYVNTRHCPVEIHTYASMPMITKLIVLFISRPENLHFDIDYNAGDYHNETNHINKYVLS
jgi:hypothetical protein